MHGSLRMSSLPGKMQLRTIFEEEYVDILTGIIGIDQDSISGYVQDTIDQDNKM